MSCLGGERVGGWGGGGVGEALISEINSDVYTYFYGYCEQLTTLVPVCEQLRKSRDLILRRRCTQH